MSIIFNCFNYREFVFIHLVHELPRTSSFVEDLLNFEVKKLCFITLAILLYCFQSLILLDNLYFSKLLLQLLFYQLLEYFVILTIFQFFIQICSNKLAKAEIIFSRHLTSCIISVSISLITSITSLIKVYSFLLSLMIVCFLV